MGLLLCFLLLASCSCFSFFALASCFLCRLASCFFASASCFCRRPRCVCRRLSSSLCVRVVRRRSSLFACRGRRLPPPSVFPGERRCDACRLGVQCCLRGAAS